MNTWFKPPWLGGDVFPSLKQAGVDYEKGKGFRFTSSTNVLRAVSILSDALGEEVEVEGFGKGKPCFICGEPVPEKEGEEQRAICDECVKNEDAYSLYVLKFQELMDNL